MLFLYVASLILYVNSGTTESKSYDGHRVITIQPSNMKEIAIIDELERTPEVNFWNDVYFPDANLTFSVAPERLSDVHELLTSYRVQWTQTLDNLQGLIDVESALNMAKPDRHAFDIYRYNRHSDINAYLEELAKKYDFCEVISIGKSYEGRDMKLIKIGGPSTAQGIVITGGIHAREWISPATSLYIIHQLTSGYGRDASIKELVDKITWYILPVVNPDGYEYSHTEERLWRKTRKPYGFCYGADANRNFDFHWMEGGSSSFPCAGTYAGPQAFSEVEAKNVADFLKGKDLNVGVFISLHSYGQLWLTPWAYTSALPDDYDDLAAMANIATAEIMKVSGRVYRVGSSTRILYIASGGDDDWAKGVAGIKYSYTVELRDKGINGFILPPSEIQPTGQEIFAGVVAMVNALWK